MKTKLIKIDGCETAKEVLLFTQYDNEGNIEVCIQCWHTKEDDNYEDYQSIQFPNMLMAERFICDYSDSTANEFANSFTV